MSSPDEFQQFILEAIEGYEDANKQDGLNRQVKRMQTFEEAGVMTMDKGLVVTLEDGSAFQITIVQTRRD